MFRQMVLYQKVIGNLLDRFICKMVDELFFKNGQIIMSEVAAEKLQGSRGIYTSRYQPRMIGLIPVIKATYMKIFQMAFSANI